MNVQVSKKDGKFIVEVTAPKNVDVIDRIKLEDDTGFVISGSSGMFVAKTAFVTDDESKFLQLVNELFTIY